MASYSYFGDPILMVTSAVSSFITSGGKMAEMKKRAEIESRVARSRTQHEQALQEKESSARQEEVVLATTASQEQDLEFKKLFITASVGLLALTGIIVTGVVLTQNKARSKGGK